MPTEMSPRKPGGPAPWREVSTQQGPTLFDGRTLSVPLAWFAQLTSASADQRRRYVLSDQGRVLSWRDFNLVISVSGLLAGPEGQTIRRSARHDRLKPVARRSRS